MRERAKKEKPVDGVKLELDGEREGASGQSSFQLSWSSTVGIVYI